MGSATGPNGLPISPGPTFTVRGFGVSPSGGGMGGRRTVDDDRGYGRMVTSTSSRHSLEELLTALRKGTDLSKHGRHGRPKMHFFRICENDTQLSWRSAKGNLRFVPLASVKDVVEGQTTDTFRRQPLPQWEHLSFSLLYRGMDDGQPRTLDLICKTENEYLLWYNGLKMVMERAWQASARPKVPAPIIRATVGDRNVTPGSPAPGVLGGPPPRPPPTRRSPGAIQGGGTAQGRITGALGLPVTEHCPGDCYIWGAARSSAVGGKSPGQGSDGWWQHSTAPALVAHTTHLDVAEVAVGGRHAGLITHSGEVHTWGEGCGGKLGQGHYDDAASPMRVTALWGQPVKHIACGDGTMAAITADGGLFTWGDGAGGGLGYPDVLRQAIPRRVDALGDLVVVQVSCGAYHSAAVSAGGSLFTWGNGLCGKLGHGDEESCAQPRQVEGLKGQRVTHTACGVWHSAAVAAERTEGGDGLGQLPFLEAHAIQEKLASIYDQLDGEGGALYTWGGEFTWVERRRDKAGNVVEKRENHRGCLGTGDAAGRLLPTRVGGALEHTPVRQVECGLNLTVAVGLDGRVWQCGETGAAGKAKWEGCRLPEVVTGALTGHRIERLAVGLQHVVALGGPMDRRTGLIELGQESTMIFTWGRGREGQLGTGTSSDSVTPRLVEPLRGHRVLKVAAGGHHTAAVCTHDTEREEAEERRRGGVKSRMQNWFGVTKLSIDLPGADRSDSSFGASTPSGQRSGRTTGENGLERNSGGGLAIPSTIPELEQTVTPRQVGTVDGPGVAGLRRTAAGAATSMQVALTGKGAGMLDIVRSANTFRKQAKARQRHSGAANHPRASTMQARRIISADHDGHPLSSSGPPYMSARASSFTGDVLPSPASAPGIELSPSMAHLARSHTAASADSDASGASAYGPSTISSMNASRDSLLELASPAVDAVRGSRPPTTGVQPPGDPLSDLAALDAEIAEIERLRAELDRRKAQLLQQQRAARGDSAATSRDSVHEPVTPAPTSSMKARERAVSMAPGLVSPRGPSSPGRRRAMSEASPRGSAHPDTANSSEMQEQVAEGVFLSFTPGPDGRPNLTRVRFSRQHFSRASAEQWWTDNRRELSLTYNLAGASGVPGGNPSGIPDATPTPGVAASSSSSAPPASRPAGAGAGGGPGVSGPSRPALTPLRISSPRPSPERGGGGGGAHDGTPSTSRSVLSSHALPVTSFSDSDLSPHAGTPHKPLGSPLGTPASWVFSVGGTPTPIHVHTSGSASRLSQASSPSDAGRWETPAAATHAYPRGDSAGVNTPDADVGGGDARPRHPTWTGDGRATLRVRSGTLRRASATGDASGADFATPSVGGPASDNSDSDGGVSGRVRRLERAVAAAMEKSPGTGHTSPLPSPFAVAGRPGSKPGFGAGGEKVGSLSPADSYQSAKESLQSTFSSSGAGASDSDMSRTARGASPGSEGAALPTSPLQSLQETKSQEVHSPEGYASPEESFITRSRSR